MAPPSSTDLVVQWGVQFCSLLMHAKTRLDETNLNFFCCIRVPLEHIPSYFSPKGYRQQLCEKAKTTQSRPRMVQLPVILKWAYCLFFDIQKPNMDDFFMANLVMKQKASTDCCSDGQRPKKKQPTCINR